jgi:hypothetical protein
MISLAAENPRIPGVERPFTMPGEWRVENATLGLLVEVDGLGALPKGKIRLIG